MSETYLRDTGRVLLNSLINVFYRVDEKARQSCRVRQTPIKDFIKLRPQALPGLFSIESKKRIYFRFFKYSGRFSEHL